jgi:flagellar basal body-associated protein FliL
MPIEAYMDEGKSSGADDAGKTAGEGVPNTGRFRKLFKRLKVPGGVGIALGMAILAYFLLTHGGQQAGTGLSGDGNALVQLESQTVNLTEPGTCLEVQIVFEASSPEFGGLLRRRTAELADIAIAVIGAKKIGELDSELERNRLKRELADAIGQRLSASDGHITNVYFTHFYYRTN